MAGSLKCKVTKQCVLQTLACALTVTVQHLKLFWNYVKMADPIKLSTLISLTLLFLNVIVFGSDHTVLRPFVEPEKPTHGLSPVFPHHFFHEQTVKFKQSTQHNQVDEYFQRFSGHFTLTEGVLPVVHVVWCGDWHFTYRNYLAVLSAFKVIRPSALYVHLKKEPELDRDGYYQFYNDLLRDIPVLVSEALRERGACSDNVETRTYAYFKILGSTGGIVLDGTSLISPSSNLKSILNKKVSMGKKTGSSLPLILAAQGKTSSSDQDIYYYDCASNMVSFDLKQHMCVIIEKEIFPADTFVSPHYFAQLARWMSYGTSEKQEPQPAEMEIVPNIVHYVWLGDHELEYFAYLSLLSSVFVMEADAVYIHGDKEPHGPLWEEVKKYPQIKFITIDFPSAVYGEPIIKFASHASDYLRADLLLRYGGVYIDLDVLFLQRLSPLMRRYNTTVNADWVKTGDFPDVINLGVLVAAPGAPFLRHFLESYHWYLDDDWSYNAIHMPYKVYEKTPSSLKLDKHVQISCAYLKCHATWIDNYKSDSADHLQPDVLNWRKDALAIHWTHPDPPEFNSQEDLMKSGTVAAEIGRFVLRKANLIK